MQVDTHHQAGPVTAEEGRDSDPAARMAGRLLLVTALAMGVMVVARVGADTDQPTYVESLIAIASSGGLYELSGASRLVSGMTLLVAAWYLSRARSVSWGPAAKRLVPSLGGLSGLLTAASGAMAISIATMAPYVITHGAMYNAYTLAGTVWDLRPLTAKLGFALAGVVVVLASRSLWKAKGGLRYVGLLSAVIGLAMQLIWIDAATFAHQITGAAFFAWLVAVGVILMRGRLRVTRI